MTSKVALTALAFALALGSASAVMAKSHHEGKAHELADPREAYNMKHAGGQTWCNINSTCNGWSDWLQGVHAKAKYKIGGVDHYGHY
jgi:hypothetical protein